MSDNYPEPTRHVLGISGGKDSAALAVYLRDRVPEMEYYFCDTGKELPETYEYLERLEIILGKSIARLNSERDFDHWLLVNAGMLPSPQVRWCTRHLKIRPFEAWVGSDIVRSYIAIRADEDRDGYIAVNSNIRPVYPFREDGLTIADVTRLLEDAGIGLPTYYSWRSRSGCFFCFFQRKYEWVRLSEVHPELFEQAIEYEQKVNYQATASTRLYTWSPGETLQQLVSRKDEIRRTHESRMARQEAVRPNRSLFEVVSEALDDEDDTPQCLACGW